MPELLMKLKQFSTPISIFMGSIVIAAAVLISGGIININGLNSSKAETTTPPAPTITDPNTLGADTGPVKVSVDDDPVLGDKNAPVTIIEFSDYECPFCKRHFDQTFPDIKKDYIDTGKVKLVYRDLPLSFHEPMASIEAIAANCAREQGGDSVYFKIHDEMFVKTTSNGTGLKKDDLYQFAADLGLNTTQFKSCLDADKYRDEIKKDMADGDKAGATGTPSFFIGKSTSDGIIEGTKIVGAQPYSAFKSIIDPLLK